MYKKKYLWLFLIIINYLVAQEVQIVTVNQYKEPNPFCFSYYFSDRFANDSFYPHLTPVFYVGLDCLICIASVDTENMRLIYFDNNYNVKYYKDFGSKNLYVTIGRQYWALFTQEVFDHKEIELYLYSRIRPDVLLASYKGLIDFKYMKDIAACISPPYIFAESAKKGQLISWKYSIKKNSLEYFSLDETSKMLNNNEFAQSIGYYNSPYNAVIGTYAVRPTYTENYSRVYQNIFNNYEFDIKEAKKLGVWNYEFNDLVSAFFIGKDKKGLYYYIRDIDIMYPTENSKDPNFGKYNPSNGYMVIYIVDPYANKVVFQKLPRGSWRPWVYLTETNYFSTTSSWSDPEGNILWMEFDKISKTFTLKKAVNTWWKELGLDKQEAGIINNNRVRIRKDQGLKGDILEYLYENEVVRILEKGKVETIEGLTAPWYKVKIWTGLEGWVFGAYIDIDAYTYLY